MINSTLKLKFCIPLLFLSLGLQAQDKTISGTVTDAESGDPLPGVSILVKGTSRGTSANSTGEYTLNAPGDGPLVLVFSFIGYQTKEIQVNDQTILNVSMTADVTALEEVVVVGYGTQRKVDLTGAVGSIRASDIDIGSKPVTSADQLMAGRIAGVQITNRSGDPGAPIDVRIRGVGTAGVNAPLWVIDGVPIVQTSNITVNTSSTTESNPLSGINPTDIESIDVLKDASAAAIYGARAANGVIMVTTKRGKDGKTQLTYDAYIGAGRPWKKLDVLNKEQYINIQSQLGRDFSEFASLPEVDWQDQVFQTSQVQSHNIGASGGNANANYFIGAGYMDQKGIELGQGFQRYSLKANSDLKIGERIKIGESMLLSSTERKIQSEDAVFAAATAAANQPFFQVYNPSGPGGFNPENADTRGEQGGSQNYVMRTDPDFTYTKVLSRKLLANVYGELEILKGLKYRISQGVDYNVGDGEYYTGPIGYNGSPTPSLIVQERPIELTTNFNQTLTLTKTFGKHSLTVLAGHEETNFRYDKLRMQGSDLFNPNIKFASTGVQVAGANEADQWALRGYLGRINYGFDDKYLFTFNIRQDYSSRFSKDNRSQAFPSFSAGWRLSQESFFPKTDFIDDLKIRASWGQSGNQFTGTNFAYLTTLQPTIFYVVGTGPQTVVRGPAPINFANPDVKWETGTQFDIGADISFFAGKMNLTFDYYHKTTNDILLGQPLPYTSGFFLPTDANIGEMVNRGIELSINYASAVGKLRYNVGANVTTIHNEVTDLGNITQIIAGVGGAQTHRTIEGESIGSFYGYKTDGIYQNQAEIDAALPDNISGDRVPGDVRFVDVSGDGKVDAEDRTNLGSPIPKFYYGFDGSASIMNFDFSFLLQGVAGQKVYNQARASMEDLRGAQNFLTSTLNHWDGEGSSNSMPRLTADDNNQNTRYSDRWIEKASFMRIRNLQIGYTIGQSKMPEWTKGMISKFRVYIAAQNLHTFTNYKGFDPEVTRGQSFQKGETPLSNGQDGGSSPQPRIVQFGWQVTF